MQTTLALRLSHARLWTEFIALFVAAPVALATLLPPEKMFGMLFAVTALGIALLHRTPGFAWRDLWSRHGLADFKLVVGTALATLVIGWLVMRATAPEALFFLLHEQPQLLVMVLILYPFLSALPQELIYRVLFFRRFGAILPDNPWAAIALNAVLFSLAHLMYWSWIVAAMTLAGGLLFAWAFVRRGSFALAVALHAVAGDVIFLVGLGLYFYSGNVDRPF